MCIKIDPLNANRKNCSLVYKFSCRSYNATYYGKTEPHLDLRSGKYIGLSPLTGNKVACKPSAVLDHLVLHEHNIGTSNSFSILCCERIGFKLVLRESFLNVQRLLSLIAYVALLLFH